MMEAMQWRTLQSISSEIASGRTSGSEVRKYFRERARRFNPRLNAYTEIFDEEDPTLQGALYGAAIAVKDLIDIAGRRTTAASRVLTENRANQDAPVIARLRAAGASFVGKTNLHEFAYGGSGVISAFGPVRNPWDTDRITGGSSSGSAAAVAAAMCAAAIGTDTAGSIRLPASLCGIVGFKPTYGAVSAEAVVPLSVSYDHVGPMTNSVADARTLFAVMAGVPDPPRVRHESIRIGIPEAYFFRDLDPEVAEVVSSAMKALERVGHRLMKVDLSVSEDRTLSTYESFCYHRAWVEKSPELYDPQTLKRIRSGEKTTPEQAATAAEELRKIRASAGEIFTDIDVLLTPTVPILPGRIDELLRDMDTLRQRELIMLRNTRPFNVLGVPAISIPWELSRSGLPVGIQLATAPHRDFKLLDLAEEFERIAPWQGRTPPEFS